MYNNIALLRIKKASNCVKLVLKFCRGDTTKVVVVGLHHPILQVFPMENWAFEIALLLAGAFDNHKHAESDQNGGPEEIFDLVFDPIIVLI